MPVPIQAPVLRGQDSDCGCVKVAPWQLPWEKHSSLLAPHVSLPGDAVEQHLARGGKGEGQRWCLTVAPNPLKSWSLSLSQFPILSHISASIPAPVPHPTPLLIPIMVPILVPIPVLIPMPTPVPLSIPIPSHPPSPPSSLHHPPSPPVPWLSPVGALGGDLVDADMQGAVAVPADAPRFVDAELGGRHRLPCGHLSQVEAELLPVGLWGGGVPVLLHCGAWGSGTAPRADPAPPMWEEAPPSPCPEPGACLPCADGTRDRGSEARAGRRPVSAMCQQPLSFH